MPQDPRPPENILQELVTEFYDKEGNPSHIYLDTKGYKTTGVGANVDDWNNFNAVNWQMGDRPATDEEKRQAFAIFEELKKQKKYGQNRTADTFKEYSDLRISRQNAELLRDCHLFDDWLYLQKRVPNFKSLPPQLQKVLLDIKYNTGNLSKGNWSNLYQAIESKTLKDIRENIHRRDVSEERNHWAEQKIDAIKNW